ncbi:MAG: ribonuclease III [Clostridiales bacterium]|jgi:ribonuclease-3|nr:ribonuclease III [Clostridiales bacterium]
MGATFDEIKQQFGNQELLEQAITHASYAHENNMEEHNQYERLEFLGDAVLELVVSEALYTRFPNYAEGQLTKFRASLVCEASLSKLSREMGVEPFLKLGKGEEVAGGRQRDSLLADVFEAILGAIYLDKGFDAARDCVLQYLDDDIANTKESYEASDFKTFLQEHLQKNSQNSINYTITSEKGPDHNKTFAAMVEHEGAILGNGEGKSKKEAEQAAAWSAIKRLGLQR